MDIYGYIKIENSMDIEKEKDKDREISREIEK